MAQIFTRSFDDDGQRDALHAYTYTHSVIHIEEEENQGTTSHKHRARFLSLDGLHSRWDASIFIENLKSIVRDSTCLQDIK